jgi:hypothetical protein
MYTIKLLTLQLWNRKIIWIKKQYESRNNDSKAYGHIIKSYKNNTIYCWECGRSLEDQIGNEIMLNGQVKRSKWVHVSCGLEKNLL